MKRRRFLAGSAAGLTVAGATPVALAADAAASAPAAAAPPAHVLPPSALDANGMGIIAAFVPTLLGDAALPTDPAARKGAIEACAYGVGVVIYRMPPVNKAGMQGLMGYLAQGPKVFYKDFPERWDQMPPEAMKGVVDGLRTNADPQARLIYAALFGLTTGVWYSSPQVWPSMNYPGPPQV